MADRTAQVEALIDKAAKAEKSDQALQYALAAKNAAEAICVLRPPTKDATAV